MRLDLLLRGRDSILGTTAECTGGFRPARLSLKLKLCLLITSSLALVTVVGGIYVVLKARNDIRDEAQSALTLSSILLDGQLDFLKQDWRAHGCSPARSDLHALSGIRHLDIRSFDAVGHLIEGAGAGGSGTRLAPAWFDSSIRLISSPLSSVERILLCDGEVRMRVVIAADPRYETDEMWSTCRGFLRLLLAFFVVVNALVWWVAGQAMRPVEGILHALEELRRGNLATRLTMASVPELSRISVGFNHMAATFERSITDNRRLTRQLLEIQEVERLSLAHDLHDEIGQCVSAIHADAAVIRDQAAGKTRASAEAIVETAGDIKDIVRSMLQRLRPPALDDLGLTAALRDLIGRFQQKNPQILCAFDNSDDFSGLDRHIGIALYRVIQECLTDIAAHSAARRLQIDVVQRLAESRIEVTVIDDGKGFLPSALSDGFGLTGMRERVVGLGGTLEIPSERGHGTCVVVNLPVLNVLVVPQ